MVSEIELFNGEGLFKKKKRSNNRNSALSNMMQEFSIPLRTESTANIKLQLKNHRAYNEEESSESIIELSTLRQNKKGVNHLEELLCEIESVKWVEASFIWLIVIYSFLELLVRLGEWKIIKAYPSNSSKRI